MERRQVLSALCGVLPLAGCLDRDGFGIEDADTTVTDRRCAADPTSEGSVRFDGPAVVVVSGELLSHSRCDDVNVSVFTSNDEREVGMAIVEVTPVPPSGTDTDCEECEEPAVCTYQSRLSFSERIVGVDLVHNLPGGGATDVAVERRPRRTDG
ncbi:hypothetical protein [Haloarchaeobius salinus]|uniref:hypothetical protein n=1 Tax=Haloarchaeobius salinus TaxID=1198298 RepID=UPI00210B483F|nr:hypothetical protein [Haloarchaeobius salinus]